MMYKQMITDGDSKAYSAVWDVYGLCDTCRKYESMSETEAYKTWEEFRGLCKMGARTP